MKLVSALAPLAAGLWILAGCQTLGGGIPQAEKEFKTDDDFRTWFAFYYKDPHPEYLTSALHYMHDHEYLDDYPDIAGVFLSRVFTTNPSALKGWCDDWSKLGAKEWDVLVLALWLTNTEESKSLAQSHLELTDVEHRDGLKAMLGRDPATVDPLVAEVVDPRQINLLWAAFSATGEDRYVNKVISYVHFYGEEGDQTQADIGEAAIMTLANNALQHESVAKACEAQNKDNPDPRTRVLLKAMLSALAQMEKEGDAPAMPSH